MDFVAKLCKRFAERVYFLRGRDQVLAELVRLKSSLDNIKYELRDELDKDRIRIPIVRSKEETLEKLLTEDCSLCRFGDGEVQIINGRSIPFQEYSVELGRRLGRIFSGPETSLPRGLLVCIPDVFGSLADLTPNDRDFWRRHLACYRSAIYEALRFDRVYYDSFVSRPYMAFNNKAHASQFFLRFRELWRDRDVVVVEGEQTRLGIGNNLLSGASSVRRILGPAKNAYSRYEALMEETLKQPKDNIVLLALGPTATVMACDLAEQGYRALDIGHIDIEYEWFLRNATTKMAIEGKYVNEARKGDSVVEIGCPEYQEQIIRRIV